MTKEQKQRWVVWIGSFVVWISVGLWQEWGSPTPEALAWAWVVIFAGATLTTSLNWVDSYRTWRKHGDSSLEERRNVAWNFVVRESILWGIAVCLLIVGLASLTKMPTFVVLPAFFGAAILIFDASIISRIQRKRLKELAEKKKTLLDIARADDHEGGEDGYEE